MDIVLEFLSLCDFQIVSLTLDLITASVWEVLITFLQLDIVLLFAQLNIDLLLHSIRVDKVLQHQLLNVVLLLTIFSKLILDEPGELLLFSDLDVPIKVMQISFRLNLLHVQIEDFSITHLILAHENALAKLSNYMGRVNQTETSFGSRGRDEGLVTVVSNTSKLLVAILRIGVRVVDIA